MFVVFYLYTACVLAAYQHALPSQLLSKSVLLNGRVDSLIDYQYHHRAFIFSVQSSQPAGVSGIVRLSDYHHQQHYRPGQHWQLLVKLAKPYNLRHSHFNYQQYLLEKHIIATGYVLPSVHNQLLSYADTSLLHWRYAISDFIFYHGDVNKRFIQALSVGDRHDFSQQDWRVLQATGTNHLLAVSGLHIGLVAGMVLLLLSWCWRFSARLCLLIPAPIAASVAAIGTALFYSALAGFALPTERAVIMLSVFLLAGICRRPLLPWHSWWLAVGILLCINPLVVLDDSFYLSFAAVAALILASKKSEGRLLHWFKPQWVVMLGVLPFSLYFFHQFSLVSPLANMITIPMVGLLVVPVCLLLSVTILLHAYPLAIGLLWLAEKIMHIVWWVLSTCAAWPWATIQLVYFPWWACGLLLLLVFAMLRWL